MSLADKEKWDLRYRHKLADYLADKKHALSDADTVAKRIPSSPHSLLNHQHYLCAGSVLDLASGDGAIALHLAAQAKFQVTAADISEQGLTLLKEHAIQANLKLNTLVLDLDDAQALANVGKFNNITLFRYRASRALLQDLASHLVCGGRFIISTFNQLHSDSTGFSARFCLAANELVDLDVDLSLLSYTSLTQLPNMDTYVFEKIS